MKDPLVSVIVTTKNSDEFIDKCLKSIKNQTYKNIEIIVVDNNSTDNTKKISKKYTKLVFNKGPERSAQRNFGAKKTKGEFLLFIDSDMELSKNVIKECVEKYETAKDKKVGGIIIPEKSFGEGFWAQCKALEREFYLGVDWIEAARFYSKKIFIEAGGFDENMISGEDWDLSQRISSKNTLKRIKSIIRHNEGSLSLLKTLNKKYYYAKNFTSYKNSVTNKNYINKQTNIISRYKLFFSHPGNLLKNPIHGLGMLFMKTSEFAAGGLGYIISKN